MLVVEILMHTRYGWPLVAVSLRCLAYYFSLLSRQLLFCHEVIGDHLELSDKGVVFSHTRNAHLFDVDVGTEF